MILNAGDSRPRKHDAPITCVIPTKNEAHNLSHALTSVRWCDEIIVVDMESDDATIDVARAFGAKVLTVARRPDFDMSRKIGLDAARNDWVLSLDADEMVPKRLAFALRSIVGRSEHDVVIMPRLNFKFGIQRRGGLWPDYQRRLYRKHAVAFVPTVHEYLQLTSARLSWLPQEDSLSLHHFNYTPIANQIAKLNTYTSTAAMYAASARVNGGRVTGFTRFVSLYFKHKGAVEGIPGLWWSAHQAFYDCFEHRKRLAFEVDGSTAAIEREIDEVNRETTELAAARIGCASPRHAASLRWLVRRLAAELYRSRFHGWPSVQGAFRDLALEVKVWEGLIGHAMAVQAQDAMRSLLAEQWHQGTE